MIERCWIYCPVSSLRILIGFLFGHAYFLGLKFEIILIISSLVQRETKNESSLVVNIEKKFYTQRAPDWPSAATEQKKLLKVFKIVCGSLTVWSSRLANYFWWITFCREKLWIWFLSRYFWCYWYFIIFKTLSGPPHALSHLGGICFQKAAISRPFDAT